MSFGRPVGQGSGHMSLKIFELSLRPQFRQVVRGWEQMAERWVSSRVVVMVWQGMVIVKV